MEIYEACTKFNIFQIGGKDRDKQYPGFICKDMGNHSDKVVDIVPTMMHDGNAIMEPDAESCDQMRSCDETMSSSFKQSKQHMNNKLEKESTMEREFQVQQYQDCLDTRSSMIRFHPCKKEQVNRIKEKVNRVRERLKEPPNFLHCLDKGVVIIINNVKFVNFKKLPRRDGSDYDVGNIINYFGFERKWDSISLLNNLTSEQMMERLKSFSEYDYSTFNSLFVFILSHGSKDGIYGSDDKIVPVNKILELFTRDKCQSLASKPKNFFFVACRNKSKRNSSGNSCSSESDSSQTSETGHSYILQNDIIPKLDDFMVCYPCLEGYESFRNVETGTMFITNLLETFRTEQQYEDLSNMLTEVNFKATFLIEGETKSGKKLESFGLSCQKNGLTKRCFFENYFNYVISNRFFNLDQGVATY